MPCQLPQSIWSTWPNLSGQATHSTHSLHSLHSAPLTPLIHSLTSKIVKLMICFRSASSTPICHFCHRMANTMQDSHQLLFKIKLTCLICPPTPSRCPLSTLSSHTSPRWDAPKTFTRRRWKSKGAANRPNAYIGGELYPRTVVSASVGYV